MTNPADSPAEKTRLSTLTNPLTLISPCGTNPAAPRTDTAENPADAFVT